MRLSVERLIDVEITKDQLVLTATILVRADS